MANRIVLCIDRPALRKRIRLFINTKHIGDSVLKDRELIVDRIQREGQCRNKRANGTTRLNSDAKMLVSLIRTPQFNPHY